MTESLSDLGCQITVIPDILIAITGSQTTNQRCCNMPIYKYSQVGNVIIHAFQRFTPNKQLIIERCCKLLFKC